MSAYGRFVAEIGDLTAKRLTRFFEALRSHMLTLIQL